MDGSKISDYARQYFSQRDLLFHCYFPVEKHVIKKNNRPIYRRGSKVFLGKSDALVTAEHHLTSQFTLLSRRAKIYEPITEDVWLMCLFHVAQKDYYTKEGRRSKRLGDLSNMYQIVEDCLEDARVIENDRQIQAHDWSRILPHHETALEVYILKYNSDKSEDDEWEQVKEEVTPH